LTLADLMRRPPGWDTTPFNSVFQPQQAAPQAPMASQNPYGLPDPGSLLNPNINPVQATTFDPSSMATGQAPPSISTSNTNDMGQPIGPNGLPMGAAPAVGRTVGTNIPAPMPPPMAAQVAPQMQQQMPQGAPQQGFNPLANIADQKNAILGYLAGALQGGNLGQSIGRGIQGFQAGGQMDTAEREKAVTQQLLFQAGRESGMSPAASAAMARNPEYMKLAGEKLFPKPYSLGKDEIRFGGNNQPVAQGIPTNKLQDAADTAQGTAVGNARANLEPAIIGAKSAIQKIDELLQSPGLSSAVGIGKWNPMNLVPGTTGANFLARYDQLKGTGFLQAYDILKGGGSITEVEGKKATDAIARMDRSQSVPEFRQAMEDFKQAVRDGVSKLEATARTGRAPTFSPLEGQISGIRQIR
jgi:hypothetical protein